MQQIASLSFEQCDLGYDDGRGAILRDVSLAAKTGETIAILGASGAGKSTLLAALCGFLVPSSGRLALNGSDAPQDLAGWEDVRRSIAWIGQRPHIFHGSFLSNVRLAAPDAAREAVGDALSLAHADRFVAQLPRDVLTILGETGFGISGGQVRRLAIARAALNPASLILCDEPTADLDADTAALVTDSLMDLAKDRILIVATHDRAVAERCDRVFYVRDGKVELIDAAELTQIDEAALLADEGADASPNDGPEASGKEVRS